MGASPHPLLVFLDFKGMALGNKLKCNSSGSLWNKVLEAQARKRWRGRRRRRESLEGCRRPAKGIKRRVRTLKKLVPKCETMGVDGLFRETADYIVSLQMRVKVMQIMVKVLTGCDE